MITTIVVLISLYVLYRIIKLIIEIRNEVKSLEHFLNLKAEDLDEGIIRTKNDLARR